MFVVEAKLCGIGKSKHKLFGVGEEFTKYRCLFFTVLFWKKGGEIYGILKQAFYDKDVNFLEYLPQMKDARKLIREDLRENEFGGKIEDLKRDLERANKRNSALNERCSDLTNENNAFRRVVKVLNDENVKWDVNYGFPDEYNKKES